MHVVLLLSLFGVQLIVPAEAGQGIDATPLVPANTFLRQHDKNGDQRLDADEVPRTLSRRFSKVDANGDGFLDAGELLHSRTRLGTKARKADELKLTRDGKVVPRSEEGIAAAVRNLLRRDRPASEPAVGSVDGQAAGANSVLRSIPTDPGVASPASPAPATASPGFLRPTPQVVDSTPRLAAQPKPPLPPTPSAPPAAAPPPTSRAPKRKGDELPSAEQIVSVLDKNGNGVLEPNETVDKLADNFKMLDKDKSQTLDQEEIDRGLRLARMFGVKPSIDPAKYRQ